MKIWSYVMSMADDCDVLGDALDSLAHFSDRIFVVDGMMGPGTLCHKSRYETPLREWMYEVNPSINLQPRIDNGYDGKWREVPLTLLEHPFNDPAHQRNWTINGMLKEPDQPDWIVWIDSDEVCSWEFISGIRSILEMLPDDVVGICPKWLTLVQDEKHCVQHMSDWLSHPRIHKPSSAYFQGNWHEHMVIDRSKVFKWDVRVIHTRALYTNRLRVQRGHDGIATGQTPLWSDAKMVDVPNGVTWPKLHWPDDEKETPFH